MSFYIGVLIAAFALYLLFWPTKVTPVAWIAPKVPLPDDGPFRVNDRLNGLQRIAEIGAVGPEGIAVDDKGQIYAGYLDGRVARFDADGRGYTLLANTGGRPFGMAPLPDGRVVVCDGLRGLLMIGAGRQIEVLSTEAEGIPYRFPNDLDVERSGKAVYFTDSSHKWGVNRHIEDVIEHGGHGRLLRYDFASGETHVLMRDLQFANGVAVGPDDAYVLVAETGQYCIKRYWLKGPQAGSSELFIDNLPGFPDNLSFNGSDRFWMGSMAPRDATLDALSAWPYLRKVIARLPAFLQPKPKKHAMVHAFDLNGNVIANLHSRGRGAYLDITSACEHGSWLYCGSVNEKAIARISLNQVFADAPANSNQPAAVQRI